MRFNKTIRTALALMLAMAMVMTAAGCGNSEPAETPYDYNLEEYITVGTYKGLEYTAFQVEVTDGDVDAAIEDALAEYTTQTEVTEGTVKSGDYVNIKYTMEVEGETIEGTDSKAYTIRVGSSGLMPDVDAALIGAKVGDTITVETAFEEDYDINPDYAGKDVTYELTIQHIVVPVHQELTDAFAKETLGAKDAADYRETVKETLYESKLADARYAAGEEIWMQVLETSEVLQYPEAELAEMEVRLEDNFKAICEQYSMTFEEVLSDILEIDEEEFHAEMHKNAEDGVKEELLLYAIARENDLELSEKEIRDYLDLLLQANNMTDEEFNAQYGMGIREYAEQGGILISLLYEEVFGFLVDQGTAK